jgi:hypothetical protein
MFSEDNFTDILFRSSDLNGEDTVTWITNKMEKSDQIVVVPAGTFIDVLNVKRTVNCNPKYTTIANPRYMDNYFAKNVGKVLYSYLYVGGGEFELRLLRYKINE